MKSRGVKYVIVGLQSAFPQGKLPTEIGLNFNPNELYDRLEKVILSKLDDFTSHDLVYVLEVFFGLKQGSDRFYEKVFHALMDRKSTLRPIEFIKLMQILPNIQYIYENSMNSDLWKAYLE